MKGRWKEADDDVIAPAKARRKSKKEQKFSLIRFNTCAHVEPDSSSSPPSSSVVPTAIRLAAEEQPSSVSYNLRNPSTPFPTMQQYSTSSHPPNNAPDATTTSSQNPRHPSTPSSSSELAGLKIKLHESLRQFPDFPSPGILFEDILPIFADADLHQSLISALDIFVNNVLEPNKKPDVVVGLEARGFLFGPSLALKLGAGFVPVRKRGKLPGPTETAGYGKEYGQDFFQIQSDGIKRGQKVLIIDDIIATGGSAAAAGELVSRLGGNLLGYVFILELDFLRGRDKLNAPVHTLLTSQKESPSNPS